MQTAGGLGFAAVLAASSATAEGLTLSAEAVKVPFGEELLISGTAQAKISSNLRIAALGGETLVRRGRRAATARLRALPVQQLRSGARDVLVPAADLRSECAAYERLGYLCEPNQLVVGNLVPDDTHYSYLYGMSAISAPTAWDTTSGAASVLVAVVDTGINYTHEDLANNVALNSGEIPSNGIDDDGNGYIDDYYGFNAITYTGSGQSAGDPMDDNGHGTHVSGTIAAEGNNSQGVVGVAYGAKLLAVKALGSTGSGSLSDVVEGIEYAIVRGAKIINMSLGSSTNSSALESAITDARNEGVLVVAAAGNLGRDTDATPNYPSGYTLSNIIAVASTGQTDQLSSFSNYGATSVDLAAPGEDILSTWYDGGYAFESGTSMATPHVAGAAALLLSQDSSLTASGMKNLLLSSVDALSGLQGKMVSGGRLNIAQALAALGAGGGGSGGAVSYGMSATSQRYNAKTQRITARLYDASTLEGVEGTTVTLTCNQKVKARKTSSASGSAIFLVKRPAKGKPNLSCKASGSGATSKAVRVRSL